MGRCVGRLGEPWTQSEEGGGVQQGQWQRLGPQPGEFRKTRGVPGPWEPALVSIHAVLRPAWRGPREVCPPSDRAAGAVAQRCGDHTLTQHKDHSWSGDESTGVLTGLPLPERPNAFIQLTLRVRFVLTILPLCLREVIR